MSMKKSLKNLLKFGAKKEAPVPAVEKKGVEVLQKHVFIAMPAYDGKANIEVMMSVTMACIHLHSFGYKFYIQGLPGNPYIDLARNQLTRIFMETGFSDMIFIDSDVQFDPLAPLKLLQHDRDIVIGVYPKKTSPAQWPVRTLIDPATRRLLVDPETKMIEVQAAATGMMRIKRSAIVKLQDAHPELMYYNENDLAEYNLFSNNLFKFAHKPEMNRWVGEDFSFSLKWRALGGKIWCVPDINFKHYGTTCWEGNYQKYIDSMSDGKGGVKETEKK
jgi:hypothetical protein